MVDAGLIRIPDKGSIVTVRARGLGKVAVLEASTACWMTPTVPGLTSFES